MIETIIRCDNCGRKGMSSLGPNRLKASDMRARLAKRGWKKEGSKDICEVCVVDPSRSYERK